MRDQLENITCGTNPDAEHIQQRARFETALSSITDGVIVTDAEALITFMNPTAERLTGWTRKEALKRPLGEAFNIVDERMHAPAEGPVPRAIRDGAIIGLAGLTILLARDGTRWPIDDSATPIRDDTGQIIGVAIIFRAVTKRRRTEKRLEVSEVRYRRLFETAHDGILILDAYGSNFGRQPVSACSAAAAHGVFPGKRGQITMSLCSEGASLIMCCVSR